MSHKRKRVTILGLDLYLRSGNVLMWGIGKFIMYNGIGEAAAFSICGLTLYRRIGNVRNLLCFTWIKDEKAAPANPKR